MSTQQVQTDGFNNAPGVPTSVVQGGQPNIPPKDMQPGFVAPQTPAPNAPASEPSPQPSPSPAGLEAAVAALTAALQAQNAEAPAQPQAQPADSLNAFDVNSIDDPILRSMATVMQTIGKDLDMDRVFAKALETGDPEFLDIAYLKDAGGENAAQLITIAQGIMQSVNAQAAKTAEGIYTKAGSEAQWNACTAAFNKEAPEALRQAVATMLNSNKSAQIDAAAELVIEFAKGRGFVPNAKPLVTQGGAVMPAAQALSKDEFQAELRKLDPNARNFVQERDALFARRTAGKQLGK